jgi:hypothetical protein
MAEFMLPANSRVIVGRTFAGPPPQAKRVKTFKI